MTEKTHKLSGWKRIAEGYGNWRIVPTDDSGDRIVAFMSRHSWANLPNDNRADADKDRVVLVSGDPLPEWAIEWLTAVNAKSCASGRQALRDAINDADWAQDRRDSDGY